MQIEMSLETLNVGYPLELIANHRGRTIERFGDTENFTARLNKELIHGDVEVPPQSAHGSVTYLDIATSLPILNPMNWENKEIVTASYANNQTSVSPEMRPMSFNDHLWESNEAKISLHSTQELASNWERMENARNFASDIITPLAYTNGAIPTGDYAGRADTTISEGQNVFTPSMKITYQVTDESYNRSSDVNSVNSMHPNTLGGDEPASDECNGSPKLVIPSSLKFLPDALRSEPFQKKFEIELDCNPGSDVFEATITQGYDERNSTTLGIQPKKLIFSSVNWTGQTVTVSHTGSPTITVRDLGFHVELYGRNPRRIDSDAFHFRFTDDGKPLISIETSSETVLEGEAVTVTVKIDQPQPNAISIPINSQGGTTTAYNNDFDNLVFPGFNIHIAANGSKGAYTILVRDDGVPEGIENLSISIDRYSLPIWLGFGKPRQAVITIEDKNLDIVVDPQTVTVAEGQTTTFDVTLAGQPSKDVLVAITGYAGTDLDTTASVPRTLTFSTSNWNQAQTVTLGAKHDPDFVDDSATLTLTATGGSSYTGTVDVTITDDDTPGIVVDPQTVMVAEGQTTTFDVTLAGQPSQDVLVAITGYAGTDLDTTASVPRTLTFSTSNWSQAQTVTLGAKHDPDFVDDSATLTLTATGGSSYTGTVDVTITDDDTPGIVAEPQPVTVAEGQTTTFDVMLAGQPSQDVLVAITGYAGTDLDTTASVPRTLTFSTSNWSQAQTVTLGAKHDPDFVDDSATLTLTATGGSSYTGTVDVTITDDDTPGIVVDPQTVMVAEGQTTTFDVTLAGQPSQDVLVAITGYAGTDLDTTASVPRTLTFSTSNWSQAQTVTLGAKHDPDFVDDSATLTLTATGGSSYTGTVDVTITDDDTPGIVVDPQTVMVAEGQTTTFDVTLAGQPSQDVLVAITGYAGTDLDTTASVPRTLTFSTSNWNQAQTVTLGAKHDPDFVDDSATLTLTATGGSSYTGTVDVTITDDDTPGIVVDPQTVTVAEGQTTTFDVMLAGQPSQDVLVAITGYAGTDLDTTASVPRTLTFSTSNWSQAQTVTLGAKHDPDFVDDSATLTLTATGGSSYTGTVDVTITDDDTPGIVVDPQTVMVAEGQTTTFDVTLAGQPSQDVLVAITGYAGTDLDTTASVPRTLTFSTSNWNQAQTVTLGAKHDPDFVDDSATLTLTATGGSSYTGTVDVTITDDDTPGIVVDPQTVMVAEGQTTTFDVTLAGQPSQDVLVAITGYAGTDLDTTASVPRTLTFSTSNWSQAQTVTLGAKHDPDFVDDSATLTLTATGGSSYTGTVDVTITDDDTPGIVAEPQPVTVAEGQTTTFDVMLAGQPSQDVLVAITGYAGTDLDTTASVPRTLTFSTSNWSQAQTVTLGAKHDPDFVDDSATLTLTATGGSSYTGTVDVTITDDDTPGIVVDPQTVTVAEGQTTTFDVTLAGQPSQDVLVAITGYAGTDLDTTASVPRTLTFSTSNWSQAQTVTLGAKHDPDFVDDSATLTLTATGGSSYTGTVDVTITDDDTPGIVVDPQTVMVAEGQTTTFDVTLAGQPSQDVLVAITGYAGTDLDTTASVPRTLTFSTSNWNQAQTVTLGAKHDPDFVDDSATLTLTATGGSSYTGTVDVTITDDDTPGIVVDPQTVTVAEGQTTTFDVMLAGQPSQDVLVAITGYAGTDLDTTASVPRTLTFSTSNWSQAQTVTLGAKHDPDFVDDSATLTLTATGGSSYTGTVDVTITDDDTPGIVVDPQTVMVAEGQTTTFDVTLAGQPSQDVLVAITGYAGTDLDTTASVPRTLTFSTSNWSQAQTVTLGAKHDPDFVDDSATLTLTATGGSSYTGTVDVTITDDDTPGIVVDPQTVTVAEGQTTTFDVMLAGQPSQDVLVAITGYAGTDLDTTASVPRTLTFSTSNWSQAQTVTLGAKHDPDFVDDSATLTLTATGGNYDNVSTAVLVAIDDNDNAPVMVNLSASSNSVTEGDAVTIKASLSEVMSGDVTINLKDIHGTTEPGDYAPLEKIMIPRGALTGSGDLLTDNDVTVEGNETFTVAIDTDQLPSDIKDGNPSSVKITIIDNDKEPPPVEVTMSVNPLQVDEGKSVTVEATLGGTLDADVIIPLILTDVTAEASRDYQASLPVQVEIEAKKLSGNYVISILKDQAIEGSETFTVALGDLPEGLATGRPTSQVVTILDVAPPKDVTARISATPNPVDEGEDVTLTVELDEELSNNVTIPLTLANVTTDEEDWQSSAPTQMEIKAGEKSGTYRISIVRDAIIEDNEIFSAILGAPPSGIIAGDPAEVEIKIIDGSHAGINVDEFVSVPEGETQPFPISLTSKPSDNVTVKMTWPQEADLEVMPITRTFTPDDWNQEQDVTLSAVDDLDLMNDLVMVTLTAIGGGYTGVSKAVMVTIIDDEVPGIVALKSLEIPEGGIRSFTVRLVALPSGPVTMRINQDTDTDITLDRTSLTFTPDDWYTPKTITATASQDDDFEDNSETLVLTTVGGGYGELTPHRIDVQIADDDMPQIKAVDEISIEEGGTHPFHVYLSAQPLGTVTVNFTGYVGTNLKLDQTLFTFDPTNWEKPYTVTLSAEEDNVDHPDHMAELMLTASGGGYDGETHNIHVKIIDNDEPLGPLTISVYDNDGYEESGILRLPIELNRPADQAVTVRYASSDGKAIAGDDYTASRGIVIFDPGAIRGVIEIQIIKDDIPEGPEDFTVMLSDPSGNATIARPRGKGTIREDARNAVLRIDDAIVLEEDGMVRFQISLSHPQRQMVSAEYRTRDGTAKAGEDYEAVSGVVTIASGIIDAIIAVPLLKDGLDWQEETFSVHLMSAKHAEIEKGVGVATIQESTTADEGVLEAYAARFVRTALAQIVEALGNRFRLATDGAVCAAANRAEMAQIWYSASSWDPSLGELLAGCRMSQSMPVSSGSFSVWGQAAFRQFNGRGDDALSLHGEVNTGILGADYRWKGGWLAGILLAHSQGAGSFEVANKSGDVTSGLTAVYPYVAYNRAGWDVWLTGGAGRGQAEMPELEGNLVSRFGAIGIRRAVATGGIIRLSYHGDILVSDAEIEDHYITAEVYRVRAGLEANVQIANRIRPYVEINIRQDGGSAETGTGLEFGGGVRFSNPSWRLRGEFRTQGLVMHAEDGFSEWGISGSLQVGSRSEGLMMRLHPSWGRGQRMSLYRHQTILDAASFGKNMHRTELEMGYSIPWIDGTIQSILGVVQLPKGIMYRLGGEVRSWERFSFSVFGLAYGRKATVGTLGVNVQGLLRY